MSHILDSVGLNTESLLLISTPLNHAQHIRYKAYFQAQSNYTILKIKNICALLCGNANLQF